MKIFRILPLLGVALVLYQVAIAVGLDTGAGLGLRGYGVVAVSGALVLAPLWLRRLVEEQVPGARRVGFLGVALGLGLMTSLVPFGASEFFDVVYAVTAGLVGALVLDLGVLVPDELAFRRLRSAVSAAGIAAAGAGLLVSLPAIGDAGEQWLFSSRLLVVPGAFCFGATALTLVLRLGRRNWGSPPEALASNAWAMLGVVPMVLAGLFVLALVLLGGSSPAMPLRAGGEWVPSVLAVAAALGLYGHTALVDERRRLQAGVAVRQSLSTGLMFVVALAAGALSFPWWPEERYAFGVVAALGAFGVALLWPWTKRGVHRLLAPHGGRLLDGIEAAKVGLGPVGRTEELAEAVLPSLRDAAGTIDAAALVPAEPLLLTFEPSRQFSLNAAGLAQVSAAPLPTELHEHLEAHPGEIIDARAVDAKVVRMPEIRGLAEFLTSRDALCVLPLRDGEHLEGAIVVPRGRRGAPLSLEEMMALHRLGRDIAVRLALLGSRDRAGRRVAELARQRDRMEERFEEHQEELNRLRANAQVLRGGRGQGRRAQAPVAYSGPMKALLSRVEHVAPLDVPVLVVAEGGTPVDRVARVLHEQSGRSDGPFVVADCAGVASGDGEGELFGTEGAQGRPGWMRLATGGTLLLADVPALSLEAQHALVEALANRQARAQGGEAYAVDLRVVATCRQPLGPLVEEGLFDAELARWLQRVELTMPALRERREDLSSLVLLSLGRACRLFGKAPMGISQQAMDRLREHPWPGNHRELQHVLERAVAKAEGPQILPEDLPPLQAKAAEDPLGGTYAEVERRVLERAMARAEGNKSEAARILGLKRTTFLDKLRRQNLDPAKKS